MIEDYDNASFAASIRAINPWAGFSYLLKTLLFNFTMYDKLGHYPHA